MIKISNVNPMHKIPNLDSMKFSAWTSILAMIIF